MSGQDGLACLPNIGPRQRRRRMVLAGIAAAIAIATAALTLLLARRSLGEGGSRVWRLAVFLPTWAAAVCYLEARSRTCVVLAARGLRNLDTGNERVDEVARRASMVQSRSIYVKSTIIAASVVIALWFVA